MTILQIANGDFSSTYGGGQVYVKNIVDEMIRQQQGISIFSFVDKSSEKLYEKKNYKGVSLYEFHTTKEKVIQKIVNEVKPDIIHTHAQKALISKIAKELNIPIVITAHHGWITCPASTLLNMKNEICNIPIKSQLVSVGSILGWVPSEYKGCILGSGIKIGEKKIYPDATILAVRGKGTYDTLGLHDDSILLGDPGLLVSLIYTQKAIKKWKLGIVPHMSEVNSPVIKEWKAKMGDQVKIINPLRKPKSVIEEIKSCENIISSSLHGLVVADAFGIPNVRFVVGEIDLSTKFVDYYSAFSYADIWVNVDGSESMDYFLSKVINRSAFVLPIRDRLDKLFRHYTLNYLKEKQTHK